jgi:hypothetical protein
MAAQRYGGKHSPGAPASRDGLAQPEPFRNRRPAKVSLRARLTYLLPLPLLFAAIGAISRGDAASMLAEVGGFAALMLSAWLLNEGLKAEGAYEARDVARPPAIPRKLFAAALTGLGIGAVSLLVLGQGLAGAIAFGGVAALAQILAFGLDPMKAKGIEGVDPFAAERAAKAIEAAEGLVRDTVAAAARFGDKRLEGRVERLCDQAREVFRTIERDPRDLTRARAFLNVYLRGLRDATVKFAELRSRAHDAAAQEKYEALLSDLEASFVKQRTHLLEENRTDLEVEIEVLRDRLQQDGLVSR